MAESREQAVAELEKILGSIDVQNADVTSSNSGANGIDLKPLTHVVTGLFPLSDKVGREQGQAGPAALYNTIKGAATGSTDGYVEEGKRGGQAQFAGVQSGSYYKSVYHEIAVTDEARYSSQIDLLAGATVRAMIEARRTQERRFLFGRSTIAADAYAAGRLTTTADGAAVAATPTPTLVSDNLGAIADGTYSVICVAVAGDAYWATKGYPVSAAATFASTAGSELLPTAARANGDGTTTALKGGCGIKSSVASTGALSTTNANRITATVSRVVGAVGYAWFVGASGSEVYQGTTSTNKAVFTKLQTGTQAAASNFVTDNSAEPLAYDGLITRIEKSGSGAQLSTLAAGATLSADGKGGITEFSDLFSNWAVTLDGYSPSWIMVGPKGQAKINSVILGSSTPTTYLNIPMAGDMDVTAGKRVSAIYNSVMGVPVPVIVNPYMPESMALFGTDSIPTIVPSPNSRPLSFRYRRDYWTNLWARTSRREVPSVVIDGALTFEWLDGFGLVKNFAV